MYINKLHKIEMSAQFEKCLFPARTAFESGYNLLKNAKFRTVRIFLWSIV